MHLQHANEQHLMQLFRQSLKRSETREEMKSPAAAHVAIYVTQASVTHLMTIAATHLAQLLALHVRADAVIGSTGSQPLHEQREQTAAYKRTHDQRVPAGRFVVPRLRQHEPA